MSAASARHRFFRQKDAVRMREYGVSIIAGHGEKRNSRLIRCLDSERVRRRNGNDD
jgi:hypothetical protein